MRRLHFVFLAAVAVIGFASVASAADMPTKAPMVAPAPIYNWSGFYIGGFAGLATAGNATTSDPCLVGSPCVLTGTYNGVPPLDYSLGTSFIGGGTIGWNWQSPGSRFVFGFENEIGYLHLRGSAVMNAPPSAMATRPRARRSVIGTMPTRFVQATPGIKSCCTPKLVAFRRPIPPV